MKAMLVLVVLWVMQGLMSEQAPHLKPSSPGLSLSDLDPFCFNGSLSGTCLEIIINQICPKGSYYPNKEMLRDTDPESFFCKGKDCRISKLQGLYCQANNSPQDYKPQKPRRSHSVNNNVLPDCARNVDSETYAKVERLAGLQCKMKLRKVCGSCLHQGLPKHHEDRTEHLLSPIQVILSYLRRSHEHLPKNVVLEKMLLDSYNRLRNPKDQRDSIWTVPVNSTQRNYPRLS